jgi:REP element-mobilizing transposase RayT
VRFDPDKHHRRSLRLRGYDYAQAGAYFVTVCTQNRACLFGEAVKGRMAPNDAGKMIDAWWDRLPGKFPTIAIDAFVVMPNHVHGIIVITHPVGATPCGRPDFDLTPCGRPDVDGETGHPRGGAPTMGGDDGHLRGGVSTVGDVVGWFKTMTTNAYIRGVKQSGWAPFDKRLWQRNYYEHIIRSEDSLRRIREYIATNPVRWAEDAENPARHDEALG